MLALPVAVPKQPTWLTLLTPATKGAGWVRVTVSTRVQPLASVTVQEYVPAVRPVAVAPVPPLGLQL